MSAPSNTNLPQPHIDENDDDFDDFDDVLEQFKPSRNLPKSAANNAAAASKQEQKTEQDSKDNLSKDEDENDEDALSTAFASEFAKGMESLMRELAENSGLDLDARDDTKRDRAMSAAWEAMLVEEMNKMPGTAPASTSTASTTQQTRPMPPPSTSKPEPNKPSAAAGDAFQSRIRNAMDKLKSSESDFNSSTTSPLPAFPGSDDPSLAALLQGLNPGEGDELTGVLEAMMGQLMSKDVLYEPLKELDEKFPSYLTSHPALPAEDKERYEKQISCIKRLLSIFENKGYDEENAKTRENITEVMGELQSYGSPPEEIMGPLPPGMAMGADGLPELPEGCVVC